MMFGRSVLPITLLLSVGLTQIQVAWSNSCPDDPDTDLCDSSTTASPGNGGNNGGNSDSVNGAHSVRSVVTPVNALLLAMTFWRADAKASALALMAIFPFAVDASPSSASHTCGEMKTLYKNAGCCGQPNQNSNFQVVPAPSNALAGTNICHGKKPVGSSWANHECVVNNVVEAVEQAGANVTDGYQGDKDVSTVPITEPYWKAGLCPVNVHWHLGAEHLSIGQYDESGTGPTSTRRLASGVRRGHRCRHYDSGDSRFTNEYNWQHCVGMKVGETYEVHWPHSKLGACGTTNQYQTPFYDGVFCNIHLVDLPNIHTQVGVQGQVFTIINDENYYYPDLMRGMIVQNATHGEDMAMYTGSTTGTSRNNTICSRYGPITWQVDRTCHLISASSFDKMCADMKQQRDDMSDDLHAHGSRETVANNIAADNHQRL